MNADLDPVAREHMQHCRLMALTCRTDAAHRAWEEAASLWALCPRMTRENEEAATFLWREAEHMHIRAVSVSVAWESDCDAVRS